MNLKKYFYISILFHILGVLFILKSDIFSGRQTSKSYQEIAWVTLYSRDSLGKKSNGKSVKRIKTLQKFDFSETQSKIPLNRLGIQQVYDAKPDFKNHTSAISRSLPYTGTLSPEGYFKNLNKSPAYQIIYNKINAFLHYPEIFKQKKITGVVRARISISKEGRLLPETLKIESSSRYLKVLVSQTLKKAFQRPLHNFNQFFTKTFEVEARFKFEITEYADQILTQNNEQVYANQLWFYRFDRQSALQWSAGPLSGLGPIPIALDLLWIVDKVSSLFSKKTKVDPLMKYRQDPAYDR